MGCTSYQLLHPPSKSSPASFFGPWPGDGKAWIFGCDTLSTYNTCTYIYIYIIFLEVCCSFEVYIYVLLIKRCNDIGLVPWKPRRETTWPFGVACWFLRRTTPKCHCSDKCLEWWNQRTSWSLHSRVVLERQLRWRTEPKVLWRDVRVLQRVAWALHGCRHIPDVVPRAS